MRESTSAAEVPCVTDTSKSAVPRHLELYKKQFFKGREQCTRYPQDFALALGKRVVVDQAKSGGKSITYRCASPTTCSFEVRVLKSKKGGVHGYFVSSFVLDHHGCTGHAQVTCRQVTQQDVAQAAVLANPTLTVWSLLEQVHRIEGITVSQRMIYRVEDAIVHESMGDYAEGFKKVESLLQNFCIANPTSHYACEFDNDGRFSRTFLSHPFVPRHAIHGQKILGIDGTFMKHGLYRETMLVLIGRNGNNGNIILGLALCSLESENNCAWFLNPSTPASYAV